MKEGWNYMKLGEIATFINGYPFKPSEWGDKGKPIIRIQNLTNPNADFNLYDGIIDSKYLVRKGDILISWSATLGVFEWNYDYDGLLNQHIFKVVFDKDSINKSYFRFVVASRINEMKKKVHGITMQHITKSDFDKTIIPVPPLETQSQIVNELDLLQSIIDKQKAQLKELDNLAQAVFYDMFGDILKAVPKYTLKDVASYFIGLTYKPTEVSDVGTIVLRSSNIQENQLDFQDIVRVNTKVDKKKIVEEGDILMCSRNGSSRLVGKVARIKNLSEQMSFGAFMTIIKSQYNDYLFYYFLSQYFRSQLITSQTATINQITTKMLDDIKLNVPPLTLQQSFASKIESIEKQKSAIGKSIEETQKLFDYTMDKYFG